MTVEEFEREISTVAIGSNICDIPITRRSLPVSINMRIPLIVNGFVDVYYNEETENNKMDLDGWRKEIDRIDSQIVSLLNDRARAVMEVGKIKTADRDEFYAAHREKQVYEKVLNESRGDFPDKGLKAVYREIMSASLALEKALRVVYLGPPASFTHLASTKKFGSSVDYTWSKSPDEIFIEVEKERADYGVVPIENSTEGVVSRNLDLFVSSDLKICAEITLDVSHNLLSKGEMKDIRRVYSHPQAIAQTKNWLRNNLPGAEVLEVFSTARAAELAGEDNEAAAISSTLAAEIYNLTILHEHIEDNINNVTRFLVIGKKYSQHTGKDKTSIMFSVEDKVGALHDTLTIFARLKINLTGIESRPTRRRAWEYLFFIDLEGHPDDSKIKLALKELEEKCQIVKILGAYPAAD